VLLDYIRVTVIGVRLLLVPDKLPETNGHVVAMVPPTATLVSAPVEVLRLNVPVAGDVAVVVTLQGPSSPEIISKPAPMMFVLILVIIGRVPLKLRYRTCQGRLDCLTLALPPLQPPLLAVALLMKPISAPAVFVMVREWSDPESVTGHVTVPNGPAKFIAVHVAVMFWELVASLFALAVPTNAPSMMVAPRSARSARERCVIL